ncbi:hypothetical protein WN55_07447 [Dufourea novaeangliae]|uniref:Uncharacterized protein n=1 Tax=Dufourea novaeangliae TaxID=178035 RepID=A0A154PS94_DUFNO|nr:hypothetical protein WN55_07447 [Dufourea novaeangliae]
MGFLTVLFLGVSSLYMYRDAQDELTSYGVKIGDRKMTEWEQIPAVCLTLVQCSGSFDLNQDLKV